MYGFSTRLSSVYAAILWGVALSATEVPAQSSKADAEPVVPQVRQINELVRVMWKAWEVKPAAPATDEEWCRRVFLDLLGRIPKVAELNEFLNDRNRNRREALVDQLLEDDQYTEEFSRNWTTIWTNLLIGRTGGNGNNSMIDRSGMQKYLRDSFARNKPYDRMVRELVTATGQPSPDDERFNGAVNFLIDKVNEENAAQATAATSRIFLGLQVQCTQCHNHPFNEWKQQTYWEMNAFFRQARANGGPRAAMMGGDNELVDRDYRGESSEIEQADLFFELRNGLVKVAYPVFVDGTQIEPHGAVNRVNRREELARLMLDSPYVEMAMVNRMWSHFLGYGFTRPVDDLGPHNEPSHPELFGYLSAEFRGSGFDVRQLIRWIVLSETYSLSSRITRGNETDDPDAGKTPLFSRFYLRQMRAEELYESLLSASRADVAAGNYEEQEQRKNQWLQQFAQAFGTDEGDETTSFAGTIPQVLMMFNGEMIRAATSAESGGIVEWLAGDSSMDAREKINWLFLAGLSRRATRDELAMAGQLHEARGGNAREALEDLWWVILNSNEFIFNH